MACLSERPGVSNPFDAIARSYDATFTDSPIGRAQRRAVWPELLEAFRPGAEVVEIGCGTGVDACLLAETGVNVFGFDRSPEMIRVAGARVHNRRPYFHDASVELATWPAEQIAELAPGRLFDGAFSNFGTLNCLSNLRHFAKQLASCLKPGAPVLVCLMGRHCVWEILWFLLQGQPRQAFRRLSGNPVVARIGEAGTVRVQYPGVGELEREFSPEFRLRKIKAVGLTVPPTYTEARIRKCPAFVKLAAQLDSRIARYPLLRTLGDHVLLRFERVGA
ncbi:MAG: methyltransferase domain-containing protein [Acidobacteria bacterium]|nr:methyltransferase domain-containing protein [Acidobacteriota bacterium]